MLTVIAYEMLQCFEIPSKVYSVCYEDGTLI